jgi:N-acetylmuramic acid 6-phosphate etherase
MLARMSLTGIASDWRRCRAKARLAQHSFANCSLALLTRQNQVRSITVLLPVSDSIKPMDTERASPRYSDIDVWAPLDIAEAMIEGQFTAVAAVRSARFALLEAALAAAERLRQGGRLVYVGAGTSGRLAVQDGAELVPTFSWPQERLLLLIAGGRNALLRSVEGAEDGVDQAARLVQQHDIGAADVVIAVAASGTTPFTVSCLSEAKRRGALTIGVANNRGTPILKEADHAIWLDTGAEPIAGSTRMKAGTAQRITLNVFSSLVMILLGRVYDGLMVDLQAVSQKLVRRSESILTRLTGSSGEQAREALRRADGNVKLAVLLLHGCDVEEATDVLNRAGGQLRAALAAIGKPSPEPADLSDLPT